MGCALCLGLQHLCLLQVLLFVQELRELLAFLQFVLLCVGQLRWLLTFCLDLLLLLLDGFLLDAV